ncbi:uncharacterized protein LOC121254959 isoform X1 [Juglans microcarpa x Juglans regia]|uniref:uncharacterized protein LOC121254959 isoform X1 n=1 Tax=Juglans microcarpa x Juglans regia TaxID=2249226 RepID=UPI001B7E522D|nr:uncharacterized protein LOC121254959 isoform X1 [Juglans microcarpa x Juglans regia]
MKEWKLLVPVVPFVVLAAFLILAVDSESDSVGEWQMLTKQNFSSQIRLHPHILLFVTLPWSGEFRSLMKEVSHVVSDRQEEFSSLKLMFMYRNREKMLADAVSATEEITILYYQHSISYKYRGRYRAQNILSSVYPYMLLVPEELPLKSLKSLEDLKMFISSTDKALLLLEFCGWTPKLLAKEKKNGTEGDSGAQGMSFNESPTNQKVAGDEKWKCGVQNGFSEVPWLGEFSSRNGSAPFEEIENLHSSASSCSLEEFQQFDSFFSKFMIVARELFLPPERHRFGLVSERSMLSSLGLEDSDSWFAVLYFAGCPTCLKIIRKADDLNNVLHIDNPVVKELEGNKNDIEPALPANKPSMLLFVDRSSNLSETRGRVKEALDAFRELALHYHISNQISEQEREQPEKPSVQDYQALDSKAKHPRLKLSPTARKIKLKEKLSTIMILNDEKHVTLDKIASNLEGSSLPKILAHLLQQNKELKLSSLVKELGFQLLSDDIDIKSANTLPSQRVQPNEVSPVVFKEGLVSNSDDLDKDQHTEKSVSAQVQEGNSKLTDGEPSSQYNEGTKAYVDNIKQLISVEAHQSVTALKDVVVEEKRPEDVAVEQNKFSHADNLDEQQLHFQSFEGSFFFSDGNYRLLRAMTGGSKIPSVVIIDPTLQQHYVLPQESNFSYSSLADFLNEFINGSLLPYQRSEPVIQSPREATRPPFVNVDFHEMDSVPRVTTHTFSELVLGFNQSDTKDAFHAWNKDVLVLFSNNWCGFCQRMELVVREVYRAVKGYMNALMGGSRDVEKLFNSDILRDALVKLPLIYLMDCTLNDCSFILKSMDQEEVYPALMLFPAERKNTVFYDGDVAVADVIKFICDHGSNSQHLMSDKGILRTVAEKGGKSPDLFKYASTTEIHDKITLAEDKYHDSLLKDRTPKGVFKYIQTKSHALKDLHETAPHVVAGSVLIATEKLLSIQPFGQSLVLIVKADEITGFQGLIINKPIRWDSLSELEEGLEILKEAPLSFGGPLMTHGAPLVALTRSDTKNQYPEVLPGVYFIDQVATIREIEDFKSGNRSIAAYWFFLGYSSWGRDQLFDEIAEGAWNVSDDGLSHLKWP